jgi:hypothetical protein
VEGLPADCQAAISALREIFAVVKLRGPFRHECGTVVYFLDLDGRE